MQNLNALHTWPRSCSAGSRRKKRTSKNRTLHKKREECGIPKFATTQILSRPQCRRDLSPPVVYHPPAITQNAQQPRAADESDREPAPHYFCGGSRRHARVFRL